MMTPEEIQDLIEAENEALSYAMAAEMEREAEILAAQERREGRLDAVLDGTYRTPFLVFHAVKRGERFEAFAEDEERSLDSYECVGTVAAEHWGHAYELCQGGVGDDTFVQEHRCRSLSVGDVLMNVDTRDFQAVARAGFHWLTWDAESNTVTWRRP